MSTFNYLTFLVSPIDPNTVVIAVRSNSENKIIQASEIKSIDGYIVTHDVWYLSDVLKDLKIEVPDQFIDINLIERFLTGRPEAEAQTKNGLSWDTYNILSKEYSSPSNLMSLRRQFWSNEPSFPEEKVQGYFFEFLEALERHYLKKLKDLSDKEKDAIFNIEMPVMNIFRQAQIKGICVDDEKINEQLDFIDLEYYKVLSQLKDKYNFKGGPFDSAYIHSYIEENGIDTDKYYSGAPVDQVIEYTKDYDERMNLLHELRRLRSSKSALLKLSFCDESKAHIIFNTFGTVTGRIMAVEPPVQFIKKRYRGVVAPEDGYDCLYIDYANYEPSILAFLSKDKKLIEAVNGGMFYNFISENILNGSCTRDVAKILFIQYSYGASINTLAKYIQKKSDVNDPESELLAKNLAGYFCGVNTWKESVIKNALTTSEAVTSDSMVRRFTPNSIKKKRSERQIVNHHVQSSGSVHLKKLTLLLQNKYPEVDILIPMFDALLLQVPKNGNDYRRDLEELFVSSFEENFGGVKAEITISNFDD